MDFSNFFYQILPTFDRALNYNDKKNKKFIRAPFPINFVLKRPNKL